MEPTAFLGQLWEKVDKKEFSNENVSWHFNYSNVGGLRIGSDVVSQYLKASKPSPIYKTFVNRCLSEKGYEIIGWQD